MLVASEVCNTGYGSWYKY